MRTVLSVKDIWNTLLPRKPRLSSASATSFIEPVLRQLYLFSKAVPRRSNRAKYKEESSHAPTMYTENEDEGKLLAGDLVFIRNGEGQVKKLIVVKNLSLENIDDTVEV